MQVMSALVRFDLELPPRLFIARDGVQLVHRLVHGCGAGDVARDAEERVKERKMKMMQQNVRLSARRCCAPRLPCCGRGRGRWSRRRPSLRLVEAALAPVTASTISLDPAPTHS